MDLSRRNMGCHSNPHYRSFSDITERTDQRSDMLHIRTEATDCDAIRLEHYRCRAAAASAPPPPSRSRPPCFEEPVRFSGGMSHEECEEYYRLLESEERIRSARSRRSLIYKRLRADSRSRRSGRRGGGGAPPGGYGGDADSCCASSLCTVSTGSSSLSSSSSSRSIMSDLSSRSLSSFGSTKSSTSVSFKQSVTVYPMPSIADYPADVCDALWFPREQASKNLRLAQLTEELLYRGNAPESEG